MKLLFLVPSVFAFSFQVPFPGECVAVGMALLDQYMLLFPMYWYLTVSDSTGVHRRLHVPLSPPPWMYFSSTKIAESLFKPWCFVRLTSF